MSANVRIEGLGKRFDRRWIIKELSFELAKGDALIVTGRNGSGKSTLLKLIAGLISPTEGCIHLQFGSRPILSQYRRFFLGLAAPELALYPTLTGKEHLLFFSQMRSLSTSVSEIEQTLEAIGLGNRENDLVGAYSTGMKQRLRMALATLHAPPLLLLDEPSSGLDEAGRKVLDEIIDRQRERGILIVATNDASDHRYGELALQLGE